MIAIMVTGNYNFFNLLYIGLCISLIDDSWLRRRNIENNEDKNSEVVSPSRTANMIGNLINLVFVGSLIYFTIINFFKYNNGILDVSVTFTKSQFEKFVSDIGTPYGIILGGTALAFSFIISLFKSIVPVDHTSQDVDSSMTTKLWNVCSTCLHGLIALFIFGISLPVFTRGVSQQVPSFAQKFTNDPVIQGATTLNYNLQLVSSYGLFRRMTGVGGRPEVIIEGSMSESGPWKEYDFMYKPGNLTEAPRFCLPHQPRLDWQMWFAALGTYQHNPWLVSLAYRILQGKFCENIEQRS
jgi:hypothetical protein